MTRFDPHFDPYAVLDVGYTATIDQIKAQYRRRAMQCHPDKGGTHEQMIAVISAWELLSDPRTRALCDRARKEAERAEAEQAAVQAEWQRASAAAAAAAVEAVETRRGGSWEEFVAWMDSASAHIQSTGRGRAAAGAVAGVLVGGALGLAAGAFTGIGAGMGISVGSISGAIGGWIAMMGRRAKPATANSRR